MSHWTKVKLKVTNPVVLTRAMKRLIGVELKTGPKKIRARETAALYIDNNIGFKINPDKTFTMIGDPYYCKPMKDYYRNEKKFQEDLTKAYAIEDVLQQVEDLNMGFQQTENLNFEEDENGAIRLRFVTLQEL